MALRVVELAGLTDVGRQREANEDNLVLAEPVFAVADGMGGARAGEVASQIAGEAFRDPRDPVQTPEEQLARIAQEANRRIYDLALRDQSRRGMGTTLTAAMVADDAVSLAHVGDSRAYRLRDGALEQLTDDHSLVAELERSGQITAEDAERHPQRAIITRALGPEAEVRVDTYTHLARPDDIYLLCSDGLTGMVSDSEIASLIRSAETLEEAAAALIRSANQSGGRDNITVVLFRVTTDDRESDELPDSGGGDETIHRGLTVDDIQEAVREQERAGHSATGAARGATRAPSRSAEIPRRSPLKRIASGLAALAAAALIATAAYLGAREVYFIGTNSEGLVTVYRGIPYELPLGIGLYSTEYVSGVPAKAVPAARRDRVLDHEWRGRSDAVDLVRQLELGTLDPGRQRR